MNQINGQYLYTTITFSSVPVDFSPHTKLPSSIFFKGKVKKIVRNVELLDHVLTKFQIEDKFLHALHEQAEIHSYTARNEGYENVKVKALYCAMALILRKKVSNVNQW